MPGSKNDGAVGDENDTATGEMPRQRQDGRPQFNAKYTDDNLGLYFDSGVNANKRQQRQDSQGSTNSTSPNSSRNSSSFHQSQLKQLHADAPRTGTIVEEKFNGEPAYRDQTLGEYASGENNHNDVDSHNENEQHVQRRFSVNNAAEKGGKDPNHGASVSPVPMNPSKSYTSFLSSKFDPSAQTTKKPSKRSSLFNKFLNPRKESTSSSIRHPESSTHRDHSTTPLRSTPPAPSGGQKKHQTFHMPSHALHGLHFNDSVIPHTTPYVQQHAPQPKGRAPSNKSLTNIQPLAHYRTSVSTNHDPARKQSISDIHNEDEFLSVPMSAANTAAQSFGISLLDEDDSDDLISSKIDAPGMSRVGSATSIPANAASDKAFWKPPESWKVRTDSLGPEFRSQSFSPYTSNSPDRDEQNTGTHEGATSPSGSKSKYSSPYDMRPSSPASLEISKSVNPSRQHVASKKSVKELEGSSRSSVRIFKGEKSSLLPCTLETTCKNILDVLRRKRFLKQDDDHMLVLKCGGLTRTLSLDEKPLRIQRTMLFLYGYTEKDNLDFIERTDLSFLFKFVVEEKGVELISEERKRMINPQNVNLDNWNLQDIPNFLYAEPMVILDVSQNPSLEFTKDFMHDSRNLTTLSFTRSGSPVFPLAIVYTPRLANLDLEVNYIKVIPPEISNLVTLTTFNIACNRISQLPETFSLLTNLQYLNLSSNRLKKIPPQIFKIQGLKKLDLSYNSISEFPEEISALKDLEVLQIAGNRLSGDLPNFFEEFNQLIKIDLRFNKLSSIDSLKLAQRIEVIRATGNNISVFRSKAPTLFEVEMNMNPLTYVYFECDMTNLKVVDFSKGKLTSCTFTARLTNVEKLSLDYNHLSVLPDHIHNMKSLTYLSIFKNNLTNLPDSIKRLTKLKHLDLHLNNIGKLNENIWYLESLEVLNLASNLLDIFPEPPDKLMNTYNTPLLLESLKSHNDETSDGEKSSSAVADDEENGDSLTSLPKPLPTVRINRRTSEGNSFSLPLADREVPSLANSLKELCLCDNKLTDSSFPTLSLFQNLNCLNLSYNDIFEIPTGYVSHFSKLKSLYLSGNYLSSLPVEDLDELQNIENLNLNGNRFGTLPAELSKLTNLSSLDVGSNQLKYNIGNIPYDWNWSYNKMLKYLNFSGNKRLEIKPQHNHNDTGEKLDSFLGLKHLRMLGLMDVTITTDAVPDQSVGVRVRSTVSQLGRFGYGISDCLGDSDSLTTRDVVIEKFRGNSNEFLITIYDGKNSVQHGGDKISKIIQETFEIHLAEELKTLSEDPDTENTKTVEDCMRGAFLTMNSEMSILINKDESSTFSSAAAHRTKTTDKLTLEEDGLSGCSATIIYIRDDYIFVANVGDIMGILTKSDGEFNIITTKHEPYAPKEYERIRDSGGYVTTDGYLDGVADVSRAVGFFKLIPHINAKPSIHKFKLTQNEEMIAIGTNEVWKRVSFELAADIIRQEKSNPIGAAEKLRDFAISYGAKDKKVTAVVLSLRQFTTKQKHHSGSKPEDSTLRKLDEEIEPPTGELAMVFTDIKNSTLLWDNYPVAMRSAIKVHNSIMRRQLRIIGGYEVKTEGDAFIVSFPTPTAALLWCFIVQSQLLTTNEWPAEILSSDQGFEVKDNEGNLIFRGLSVRMGLHWGTPVCEMDIVTKRMDYFGPMVNRASRVSSVADGGQITMSTDFYYEMEKVKKIHRLIKESKLDLGRAYGYKAKDKDVENQMNQLENIGMVLEHIGAKKLKGLETPENIWLIFPKPLSSRLKVLTNEGGEIQNKSSKLLVGGITVETVWTLRKIAIRLEKLVSRSTTNQRGESVSHFYAFIDKVQKESEDAIYSKVSNMETFVLLFLDHTITRIENCVTVLGTRQILSGDKVLNCDTVHLLDLLKNMAGELSMLRARVDELEHDKKIVAVDERLLT
ncbi:Putative adenylate cyclase [Pichia membranifaciens]|uniref:Putative adenylate cyclase n=1 Tax=Pichia membranifaciens TaxID=4926 RepID=A0A1Q2YEM1_9ASCO|nr:Putative adenylate cyclase [Pichia membranifaciens]